MADYKYTDEERLSLFMDSAHNIIGKDYWETKIRPLGDVRKYDEYEMQIIFATGLVKGRRTQMEQSEIDFAALHMRRFLTESETLHTEKVLKSIDTLGIAGPSWWLQEVKSSWRQMNDKKFPFHVYDGVTVGMRPAPGERLVRWDKNGPSESEMQIERISLIDVCDAYFNTELFHDDEPWKRVKKQEIRKIAKSIPLVLAENLRAVAISSTVLNFVMLHRIVRGDVRFKCGASCTENKILKRISNSHLKALGKKKATDILSGQ